MKLKLYQVDLCRDDRRIAFMGLQYVEEHGGIRSDDYALVFDGEVEAEDFEKVFYIFNLAHPEGYIGRSMSVSDVVVVDGEGAFYCDTFGFAPLPEFQKEATK